MLKMSNYAYLFPLSTIPTELQRKALKAKANFNYIFNEEESENEANKRTGFNLLLNHLKTGDKVYVHTLWCLVNENKESQVLIDIITRMTAIHEKGASLYLVDNQIDTGTPQGRLNLVTIVSTAQYIADLKQIEIKNSSSSNSSCSSIQNSKC